MQASEVVTAVAEPIGAAGAASYFHPNTLAKGKELGLDGFRFYILGRGGVLGDVSAKTIRSAFGYFSQPLLDKIWNSAKDRLPPDEAAAAYLGCNAELGRIALAEVEGLGQYCDAAEKVIGSVPVAGLTLYSGFSDMAVPQDLPALALHYTAVLRELRGSVHLLAIVASGLDDTTAHAIRRPDDVQAFGYETAPEITESDRAMLGQADVLTDRMMADHFGVLDAAEGAALATGAEAINQALT